MQNKNLAGVTVLYRPIYAVEYVSAKIVKVASYKKGPGVIEIAELDNGFKIDLNMCLIPLIAAPGASAENEVA